MYRLRLLLRRRWVVGAALVGGLCFAGVLGLWVALRPPAVPPIASTDPSLALVNQLRGPARAEQAAAVYPDLPDPDATVPANTAAAASQRDPAWEAQFATALVACSPHPITLDAALTDQANTHYTAATATGQALAKRLNDYPVASILVFDADAPAAGACTVGGIDWTTALATATATTVGLAVYTVGDPARYAPDVVVLIGTPKEDL